jgi:hypothetical protein
MLRPVNELQLLVAALHSANTAASAELTEPALNDFESVPRESGSVPTFARPLLGERSAVAPGAHPT